MSSSPRTNASSSCSALIVGNFKSRFLPRAAAVFEELFLFKRCYVDEKHTTARPLRQTSQKATSRTLRRIPKC